MNQIAYLLNCSLKQQDKLRIEMQRKTICFPSYDLHVHYIILIDICLLKL